MFVDIRSIDEYDMDHIEGAVSLPVVDFISNPKLLQNYNKDKELTAILYSVNEMNYTAPSGGVLE